MSCTRSKDHSPMRDNAMPEFRVYFEYISGSRMYRRDKQTAKQHGRVPCEPMPPICSKEETEHDGNKRDEFRPARSSGKKPMGKK